MKKSLFLTLLGAGALTLSAFAQNLDRENLTTIRYTQLPLEPLDTATIKTYKISVSTSDDNPYVRDLVQSTIGLDGFKKVKEGDADLTISVEVYPISASEAARNSKDIKTKKDGVETTTRVYYYTSEFTHKTTLSIKKANGEEVFTTEEGSKESISGGEDANGTNAYNSYVKAKNDAIEASKKNDLSALRRRINSKYGYSTATATFMAFKIKPKKFNYDAFNSAFPNFNNAINKYNSSKGVLGTDEALVTSGIDALNKDISEYVPEDKKARVDKDVASAAYYNIAIGYFIIQKYDDALTAMAKAEEIRKGIGQAVYNKSIFEDMSKRYKANNKM